MLVIKVEDVDSYDEKSEQFITVPGFTIELEHSLASISKWESIYEKPFLSEAPKTYDETLGYIDAMTLGPKVSFKELKRLPKAQFDEINDYLISNRTATWFNDPPHRGRARETVTSEVVYFWMISLNIPFECEQWHFNRLLTLIKIVNSKNAPQKKAPRGQMAAQRTALNAARMKQYNTNG